MHAASVTFVIPSTEASLDSLARMGFLRERRQRMKKTGTLLTCYGTGEQA